MSKTTNHNLCMNIILDYISITNNVINLLDYISRKIYSKNSIKEIDKKIKLLGVSATVDTYSFLNIRLFGTIFIFILILFVSRFGYALAPLLSFAYYKLITYILLDNKINQRRIELEREAMHFFEVLTLSLEIK